MPTYAWVAIGMLISGIGGAVATWGSLCLMYRGLPPQPAEVVGNLTALGGVFAGLCGGITSMVRGSTDDRQSLLVSFAALGLGIGVPAAINPAFLFSPFLLVIAPLQGLAAMLGGLATLAVSRAVLRRAGVRDHSERTRSSGATGSSPLRNIGLLAMALGLFVPFIPSLKDVPEIHTLGHALFYGGILLVGVAFVLGRAGSAAEPNESANSQ